MNNRLTEYEQGVIDRAEAYEKAHLMQTGLSTKRLDDLRNFIRAHKREDRRDAAKAARPADLVTPVEPVKKARREAA